MSLARAFATVGFFTLLSRITGFLRDILTASFLGAGAAADAFLIAFQFPNLFRRLFAEGAFSAGFVPIFARQLARDGVAAATDFANAALAMLLAVLLVFTAVMIVIMPWALFVIAPGFDRIAGQMERTTELARIAFPYLLFVSLVSLQTGVLNALDRFAAGAAAPILLNLTIVGFLLAAVAAEADTAVFMAWGVSTAGVVQLAFMAHAVRAQGIKLRLVRPRLTPQVRDLLARMLPVAFGAGIYQLNLMVDKVLATLVSVGAVSWLYYADRVNQLPVGVVGVAVGVALLPLLARQIHAGQTEDALASQNRAIELCLFLTLPAAVGIGVLAGPIAATLFERGAFTVADRDAVAGALAAFALGLPAYVLNKALTPGFFGRLDTKTPVLVAAAAMVVNVAVSVSLMGTIGHVGIAIATSVSAWVNAAALAWLLRRRGYLKLDARLLRRLPRTAAAAAAMAAAISVAEYGLAAWRGAVFGAAGVPAGPEGARVVALVVLIAVGAVTYLGAALALGAAARRDLAALRRRPAAARPEPSSP